MLDKLSEYAPQPSNVTTLRMKEDAANINAIITNIEVNTQVI